MKKPLFLAFVAIAALTAFSFYSSAATSVPESVCPPENICILPGYVELQQAIQTPELSDEEIREELKDTAKSPYADAEKPPALANAAQRSSYEALRDVNLVLSKVRWQRRAYEACLQHLDETIDAANAACGGSTIYKGVDITVALIVLAYTESGCGTTGKIYMGVKGKTGDAATQIPAAARLLRIGLDGKGPYEGCDNNFYCVLNRYTPEGIEGNEYGYNAMRMRVANQFQEVLNAA